MQGALRLYLGIGLFFFLLLVLLLLRQGRLNLRYTLAWLFSCLAMFLLLLFPKVSEGIASLLGIVEAVNAVFLLQGFMVMLILLSLTAVVSHLNSKSTVLTQQIAILEERLRRLEHPPNEALVPEQEKNMDGKRAEVEGL